MNFKKGHRVSVARPIMRSEDPEYAKEGDTGEIIKIFLAPSSSAGARGTWHAQVRMDNPRSIKESVRTFRLTTLTRLDKR